MNTAALLADVEAALKRNAAERMRLLQIKGALERLCQIDGDAPRPKHSNSKQSKELEQVIRKLADDHRPQ